jgi:hypothetical protein
MKANGGKRGRALVADVKQSVFAGFEQLLESSGIPRSRDGWNLGGHVIDKKTENASLRRYI